MRGGFVPLTLLEKPTAQQSAAPAHDTADRAWSGKVGGGDGEVVAIGDGGATELRPVSLIASTTTTSAAAPTITAAPRVHRSPRYGIWRVSIGGPRVSRPEVVEAADTTRSRGVPPL